MMEKTEKDIEVFRNEQGEFRARSQPGSKDFAAKFCKFISDHYLRKFHCFHLYSTHPSLITIFAY